MRNLIYIEHKEIVNKRVDEIYFTFFYKIQLYSSYVLIRILILFFLFTI
jgi:hypothetical protein